MFTIPAPNRRGSAFGRRDGVSSPHPGAARRAGRRAGWNLWSRERRQQERSPDLSSRRLSRRRWTRTRSWERIKLNACWSRRDRRGLSAWTNTWPLAELIGHAATLRDPQARRTHRRRNGRVQTGAGGARRLPRCGGDCYRSRFRTGPRPMGCDPDGDLSVAREVGTGIKSAASPTCDHIRSTSSREPIPSGATVGG